MTTRVVEAIARTKLQNKRKYNLRKDIRVVIEAQKCAISNRRLNKRAW